MVSANVQLSAIVVTKTNNTQNHKEALIKHLQLRTWLLGIKKVIKGQNQFMLGQGFIHAAQPGTEPIIHKVQKAMKFHHI